ncbi:MULTISPECIES: CBS domain-containing protein [Acidiplasma]|jgi:predicted transcriptional regulator|uniref:Transcriptional regulator n=2 Tax=Acidiplasma TaxID=507753 RepID=A0A0Q0RUN5_9ARCH|nr:MULTISPECIES: CBS domain-containing protein [Acidiplasma]KJE49019.1 transcriptional regulator [Acidiplasma sp. MBA-1]KPV47017.1 transcriptional regulator [Acidiplasma aeolicum]KQB34469.1 transcriptional regulator [Acidiplasma aeolicum]KQB36033.1 transcriptional regulator [Acidiplasma cupricumulans]WMT54455.1 MAG: CBS domain-containing protein [Acidiplasma sp.]
MLPSIEELRKMRKSLGISQKELARISGVSQSYIARLEKGEINPAYDKVRKIFEYLNASGNKAREIDLKAEIIMTKNVVTCEMNDSIITALNKMREKGFSQLPVVTSDRRIIGTITESDINDMLIKGTSIESLKHLTVRKVMGAVLPQLDKDSPISMIYPLLKYSNAVLIVDGTELKGIITKADILKAVETYG